MGNVVVVLLFNRSKCTISLSQTTLSLLIELKWISKQNQLRQFILICPKTDQLKLRQRSNNQLHLIALAKFFCVFDFVRPFSQSNLIVGLISIELGCMILMTRCLIRYVGYTGNSLLASTEWICKHNVIATAVYKAKTNILREKEKAYSCF